MLLLFSAAFNAWWQFLAEFQHSDQRSQQPEPDAVEEELQSDDQWSTTSPLSYSFRFFFIYFLLTFVLTTDFFSGDVSLFLVFYDVFLFPCFLNCFTCIGILHYCSEFYFCHIETFCLPMFAV